MHWSQPRHLKTIGLSHSLIFVISYKTTRICMISLFALLPWTLGSAQEGRNLHRCCSNLWVLLCMLAVHLRSFWQALQLPEVHKQWFLWKSSDFFLKWTKMTLSEQCKFSQIPNTPPPPYTGWDPLVKDFAISFQLFCSLKALTLSTPRVLTNFAVIFRPNSKLEGVCSSNLAESDGMGN